MECKRPVRGCFVRLFFFCAGRVLCGNGIYIFFYVQDSFVWKRGLHFAVVAGEGYYCYLCGGAFGRTRGFTLTYHGTTELSRIPREKIPRNALENLEKLYLVSIDLIRRGGVLSRSIL